MKEKQNKGKFSKTVAFKPEAVEVLKRWKNSLGGDNYSDTLIILDKLTMRLLSQVLEAHRQEFEDYIASQITPYDDGFWAGSMAMQKQLTQQEVTEDN